MTFQIYHLSKKSSLKSWALVSKTLSSTTAPPNYMDQPDHHKQNNDGGKK